MAKTLSSILKSLGGSAPAATQAQPSAPSGMDPMLLAALGQTGQPAAAPSPEPAGLADLYSPQVQQPAPAMPDNPYTPADNVAAPQQIANSVGTPDSPDINVTGDAWKPHKESFLGRLMDTMFEMDGHKPVFQNRTDSKNLENAMQGTDKDPAQLIDRVKKFNPELAWQMQQDMSARNANDSLTQQRTLTNEDAGRTTLGNMLTSIQRSADPAAVYTKQLPMLQKYADAHGLSGDLPEQYDSDALNTYRNQGISGAQQQSLDQNAAEHTDLQKERQSDVNLREKGLQIETYNAQTSRLNAETARDSLGVRQENSETMSQKQALYKKVLGGASSIPWLYGGFVKGIFGAGNSGIPKPGTAYVSPDKTMAVKMNSNGSWSVYDLSKGVNHAREIQRLGGVIAGATDDTNGDFSN